MLYYTMRVTKSWPNNLVSTPITGEMSDFTSEDLNIFRATLLGSLNILNNEATASIQASWTARSDHKKRYWQQQPWADQAKAEAPQPKRKHNSYGRREMQRTRPTIRENGIGMSPPFMPCPAPYLEHGASPHRFLPRPTPCIEHGS